MSTAKAPAAPSGRICEKIFWCCPTVAHHLNTYSRKMRKYMLCLTFSSIFLFFVNYHNLGKHFRPLMKEIILQKSYFRCRENKYIR